MLKVLADETGKSQTAKYARGTKRILLWGIAVVVGVAILACFILTAPAATSRPVYFRIGLGALISILLAALPLLISFVQTTSRDRQLAKLHSICHSAAAETDCYKIAVNTLGAIKPASLDKDYTLPMLTFATAVVFGCLLVFLGAFEENFFRSKSFVLGGMAVLDLTDEAAISSYQRSSFLAGSMAFVGSYVNPFILWPRLPYDLTLIVDWIAQAQLYKFAKEEGTKRLRSKGIDNICALYAALSNAEAAGSVAELIQVSASTVPAYITIFDQDPSFRRLREVRGALADAAPDGQPESGSGAAP